MPTSGPWISPAWRNYWPPEPILILTLLLPGVALIITGIGFKLALVPFHMWTPDVYQGRRRR